MVAGGHTHLGQSVLHSCALCRLQGVYSAHLLDRVLPHRAPVLGGSFFNRFEKGIIRRVKIAALNIPFFITEWKEQAQEFYRIMGLCKDYHCWQ